MRCVWLQETAEEPGPGSAAASGGRSGGRLSVDVSKRVESLTEVCPTACKAAIAVLLLLLLPGSVFPTLLTSSDSATLAVPRGCLF